MNTYKDSDLREALRRREDKRQTVDIPEDFTELVMDRIEQLDKPHRRRVWLYPITAIAVAASILLLFTLYHHGTQEVSNGKPIVAQHTEPRDTTTKPKEVQQMPTQLPEPPIVAKTTEVNQRQKAKVATVNHQASTTITDSLDYYIDKIERELVHVDESLYIERMNRVIRADKRLQRIVNSYILHTLDEEGRPQTAENMNNIETEQNEE